MDPGTAATGYGLVEGDRSEMRLVECGVIRSDQDRDLPHRLRQIHEGLLQVIDRLSPECLSVEGVYYGPNVRTAVVLGHARGVIVLAGASRELPVAEYPPAEIKMAVVGSGNASKEQVGYMVKRHLSLKDPPEPADAADGCAAAICHLFRGTGALAGGSDR